MIVKIFKGQFVDKVRDGLKTQTIRQWPKREPRIGDTISLRHWQGKAYRSPQVTLRDVTLMSFSPVIIYPDRVVLPEWGQRRGQELSARFSLERFAIADGFDSWDSMAEWFQREYQRPRCFPFQGSLWGWENVGR